MLPEVTSFICSLWQNREQLKELLMLHGVLLKKAAYIKKRYCHEVCGGDTKRASDCVHLQEKEMEKNAKSGLNSKYLHIYLLSTQYSS